MITASDGEGVISLGGSSYGCTYSNWMSCGIGNHLPWTSAQNVSYRLDCPSIYNCTWTELPQLATKRKYLSAVAVTKFKIANCEF